jgi:glycogen synthase
MTGFLFHDYSPAALDERVRQVLERFADQAGWRTLIRQAMKQQFGWDQPTIQYEKAYAGALATRRHR